MVQDRISLELAKVEVWPTALITPEQICEVGEMLECHITTE
jgi:hypothetical protein